MKKSLHLLAILLFVTTIVFAQDSRIKPKENSTNGMEGVEAPEVVEGEVIFSDGTNQLLRITDEGTSGALQFQDGIPSVTDFKLYRNGTDLYFGTINLSGIGTALGIDDLIDARHFGTSLYLGNNAGNNLLSTGDESVGIGYRAAYHNTTGSDNVAIGYRSNYNNQTGDYNTIVGATAGEGSSNNSINGSVFLGYEAGFNETTDNKLYIENSSTDAPLIWGDFENDSVKVNGKAHITTSLSVGSGSKAVLNNSISVGNNTEVHGLTSIAVGEENLAFGFHSSAFGLGIRAMSYVGTAIGRYNVGDALDSQTDWNETDVIFEIGNGADNANRSNAVTVLKNGNVGFGPSAPTTSLHVNAVNGVLFDGATTGAIPVEGSGSRMMWYQGKSAFRAGDAGFNNAWDDVNIGQYSTALNYRTMAKGSYSFATGYETEATGQRSTAMGSSTKASGIHSTAIGSNTEAIADFSTAIGRYVKVGAAATGTIFIGDNSVSSLNTASTPNRFSARFDGGYRFFTKADLSTGALMNNGDNSWSTVSDSTKKENFLKIDGEEVLNKISRFNLRSWNYIGQDPTKFRHYGPMAQEFYSAFGNDGIGAVGNDTTIASADFDGINLIAIQALEKRSKEQVSSIQSLESRIKVLEDQNRELAKINAEYRTKNAEFRNQNLVLHKNIEQIKEAIHVINTQNKNVNIAYTE